MTKDYQFDPYKKVGPDEVIAAWEESYKKGVVTFENAVSHSIPWIQRKHESPWKDITWEKCYVCRVLLSEEYRKETGRICKTCREKHPTVARLYEIFTHHR